MSTYPSMLEAALEYAAQGRYVIPLHIPVFDTTGKATGCTCEAHKRSDNYRRWLEEQHAQGKQRNKQFDPNYTCRTPGKHPRISTWEAEATTDPAQIREWWGRRWPNANIALAAGKSDLLVLDADSYKENFAGEALLSQEDEQTATALTGSGGQHYYYAMPEGATYGNHRGNLPAGIDIRGHGGLVVVYPSLHASGSRYEWEDGYSLTECPPRPLPAALATLLDAAQAKSAPVKAVTFTTPTTEAPQLGQWRVSSKTLELIHNPPPAGQRSEADMSVTVALVYAGATDTDILSVFEHNPIGSAGKFAQAGRVYLAHTIGKARSYVEANPRPDVPATIAELRTLIKTINLADHVGAGQGRRSLRRVADTVFDLMEVDGRLFVNAGKKRIAKLAGVSAPSASAALKLLDGVLFDVAPDSMGARIALVEKCRLQKLYPSFSLPTLTTGGKVSANDDFVYSTHKADDAFVSGFSRHQRREIANAAEALDLTFDETKAQYTQRAPGEGVLLAYDVWGRIGDLSAQALAEETGVKLSAARSMLRLAERFSLAESYREGSRGPKMYTFALDFWQRIEEVTPHLHTYKIGLQREDDRLVSAVQWTQKELKATQEPEQRQTLRRRIERLSAQRVAVLESLHDDLQPQEAKRLAYDVTIPFGPHPATQAKLERLHGIARVEVEKAKFEAQAQLVDQVYRMRSQGDGKREIVRKLTLADYTPTEAWAAINQVYR